MEPTRIIRNVLANWGGFVLSALVNFFLAPFVVQQLGNSLYGISVLFLSLTGYLGMLDLGVRGALTRYVARFHARSEHHESGQVVSAALVLFGAAGAAATLLTLVLAVRVDSLPIPPHYHDLARILLILLGPNVAVSLLSGVFSGVLMALHRFEPVNLVGVLTTVVRAIVIVAVLSAGGGLVALVWIQLLTTLVATLACAWICFRVYPELRIRFRGGVLKYVGLIVPFSAYSFLLLTFDPLLAYLVSLLVGTLGSAQLVTFFWIGANLVNYSRAIVGGISKTSTPLASALEAQGDQARLQQATLNTASFATVVVLPMAVTFLFRGSSFVGLWMGPEYSAPSGRVLWILTISLIFSASSQIALATVLGISKHKALVPVFLGQAIATLVASAAVFPRAGVVGVAWAMAIPHLAVSLLFWPAYLRKTVGVPLRACFEAVWLRPLLAALPFALGTYALEKLLPASNLAIFFLQTGALLPLALAGSWYLCLTKEVRSKLLETIRQPSF
jgi:O-antigen/teichoic acid export membrane protein